MTIDRFPTEALSIRQPWAHHILFDGKTVENRSWLTRFRGRFLIHASATFDGTATERRAFMAAHPDSHLGGIVGMATLTDLVTSLDSPWFYGPYAFVLTDPKPLDFVPCKGKLGFFTPDIDFALLKARAS
ncbi:ASCH domain-containing protein [Thalassospira sp. MCCC 1A01428]|uniref:ASCH domain-containing protein n=1 Tax=Thalassospira sp. MCCC 1A01428 TaxID=1470575 RepID=UPI000A1D7020|nr:ASCH domain-containing protein [Thalassospira sp. MCCC 1A01428]OSQ41657.1 hypothetical protein THS27_18230 [Thalassospira sp. MCCC 1A01428]